VEQDLSAKQINLIQAKIQAWPNVGEMRYQTAEQSLIEFRESSGLGGLLDSLPDNPLPAVITLFPADNNSSDAIIQSLLTDLSSLPEVAQAQLDMAWLQRLRSLKKFLARGISLLGLLLSLSVLLVIGNTIRLAILNRQSEIKVMKLVGATDRFIRRPFLYTGFWYGFIGGLFAWFTLLFVLSLLTEPVYNLASLYGSEFGLPWFTGLLLPYLPLAGISLGIIGAWLAVNRHLHAIEPN
jgi:cell division transport system permease protein